MSRFEQNPQLQAVLHQALAEGSNQVVVTFQEKIRARLSRKGTGALYGLQRSGPGSGFNVETVSTAGRLGLSLDKLGRIINEDGRRRYEKYLKKGKRSGRSDRSLGFHRASAPGQPPAVNTGRLYNSWEAGGDHRRWSQADGTGYTLRLGSNLNYAVFLEDGTRNMAYRPYFVPTMDEMYPIADKLFAIGFRRVLRRFKLKP